MASEFGYLAILRLGLVQTSLGAIVVLTTSTLNRVMVIELALPALVPGILVTLHHALQMLRPRWGWGSDRSRRRTPWIVGGMATLATGGVLAALSTAAMTQSVAGGLALGVVAFGLIGVGVGAAGTSLLVLLAERVAPGRKAQAATIVWMMMIAGFVITAGTAGHLLEPFSLTRLVEVTAGVSVIAFLISAAALWRLEGEPPVRTVVEPAAARPAFSATLKAVWGEAEARHFTIFIFVSMLAYSAQDLILEPFAGIMFGMSPGATTKLGGVQNAGVLAGMAVVAVLGHRLERSADGVLRRWMIGGCVGSGAALMLLALSGVVALPWPIHVTVAMLGFANGVFAIAAIGSMMALACNGESRNGTRMGLWGAAQAIGFGLGGLVGTASADLARLMLGTPGLAYAAVFAVEACVFAFAATLAAGIRTDRTAGRTTFDLIDQPRSQAA